MTSCKQYGTSFILSSYLSHSVCIQSRFINNTSTHVSKLFRKKRCLGCQRNLDVTCKRSLVEKMSNWLVETPLIVPLWYAARRLMTDTAEKLGIRWREQVRELAQSRTDW